MKKVYSHYHFTYDNPLYKSYNEIALYELDHIIFNRYSNIKLLNKEELKIELSEAIRNGWYDNNIRDKMAEYIEDLDEIS